MEQLMNNRSYHIEPDNLIYGTKHPIDVDAVELIVNNEKISRGTVIAKINTSGRFLIMGDEPTAEEKAAGGKAVADCIAAREIDVSDISESITVPVYTTGQFNENSLVMKNDYELTEEDREQLRKKGIFLKTATKY